MNGSSIKKTPERQGVSLIEVLVALCIGAVLIGIISSGFPSINRLVNKAVSLGAFSEPYLIFLIRFEEEYQLAEAGTGSGREKINNLIFQADLNLDNDYTDSGESIHYRWNKSKNRVDRKSGKGYYQSLLEGVNDFSWQKISSDPFCHQMTIQDSISLVERNIMFCKTPVDSDN